MPHPPVNFLATGILVVINSIPSKSERRMLFITTRIPVARKFTGGCGIPTHNQVRIITFAKAGRTSAICS
jgi:hypothetical protein